MKCVFDRLPLKQRHSETFISVTSCDKCFWSFVNTGNANINVGYYYDDYDYHDNYDDDNYIDVVYHH